MIDQLTGLCAALSLVFALVATLILMIWRDSRAGIIGGGFALLSLFALVNTFLRADEAFDAAHPPPLPPEVHTVTVRCPP